MASSYPKIRHDLIYRVDESDDNYWYVKDPVRAQFYRFNELQVAMMKELDGVRSPEEIAESLSEEYELEIGPESVQRVVARLEKELLLDVSTYRLDSETDRKLVRKFLKKRNLTFRDALTGTTDRKLSKETVLFQEGVRQIERGDPCEAAHYFGEVLELNPKNVRARQILDALHEAFFRRHRVTPSHLKMLHLWDPDRFLGWLDRRIGGWVMSSWGVIGSLLFLLFALTRLPDLVIPPVTAFGAEDFVVFYVLYCVMVITHELAHGLACKHYGGSVNDMGVLLMYGVMPGAYCDTSDTYLIHQRQHKMAVQLAGVFVNIVSTAVLILLCWYTSEAFFLRDGMLILLVVYAWDTVENLIPLIKLDGYYALADWLGVRNLRERSFQHCSQLLKKHLLGIEETAEELTPREARIFVIYGVLAGLYTALVMYFIWISFLLPLAIEYLGTIGVILTVIYAYRTLRRLVFLPVVGLLQLLWRHRRQVFTPARTAAFALSLLALVAALSLQWPFYTDAHSQVEPVARSTVFVPEEGLVEEVLVREGQQVQAGQVLARLVNDDLSLARIEAQRSLEAANHRLDELRAGARPEELRLARARKTRAAVASLHADRNVSRKTELARAEVLGAVKVLEARQLASRASAQQAAATIGLELVTAGHREEDVAQVEAEVRKLESQLTDLDQRLAKLVIRSPISGTIVGRRLETLANKRFASGDALCEVHDLSGVRVEITLRPTELFGKVEIGQEVALRVHGDPNRSVWSRVEHVQPSATADGSIVVATGAVPNPGWISGMTGYARIYGGSRSVAYRLFGVPILRLISYDAWRLLG